MKKKSWYYAIKWNRKDKKNIYIHENYKWINNNYYTGIIFKYEYRVQRILNNITDKYAKLILLMKINNLL